MSVARLPSSWTNSTALLLLLFSINALGSVDPKGQKRNPKKQLSLFPDPAFSMKL